MPDPIPGESLHTPAEQVIEAVNRYHEVFRAIVIHYPDFEDEWSLVMDNLAEVLQIFYHNHAGYGLLMKWYKNCSTIPAENIHQFIQALWAQLMRDQDIINVLADQHYRRCIWELALGIVLLATPPALMIYMLPLLANPVVLAPVFILTCVIVPLISHFLLISPGIDHYKASNILKNALPSNHPSLADSLSTFFAEPRLEAMRKEMLVEYNQHTL